jgi:C4-dicarboxylate-specific signal transduction histidine kinase
MTPDKPIQSELIDEVTTIIDQLRAFTRKVDEEKPTSQAFYRLNRALRALEETREMLK